MSDDSSPVFRRRPRQTVAPKSPDSPSQGRAASGASPDSLSRPKLKLAVPPTPGSEARANERAVGRQEKEECPPTPDSDARKAARANKRAVRRQEKEERRKKREERKRESDTNRQRYLNSRFMARQAKEVDEEDESVEGSSDSVDDGHATDESNITHGSDHPVAPRNIYTESLNPSQGQRLGFGTPMHLQRGRASFRCYRHSLATPVCFWFWSHLTCTDHPSIQLLLSQKTL